MSWDSSYSAPFKIPGSPSPDLSTHHLTLCRALHQGAPTGFFVSLQLKSLQCLRCCREAKGTQSSPATHFTADFTFSL